MQKRQAAFTLIEVMVVIVIMAIVATIAVVMFSGFAEGRRLKSAALQMRNLLVTAQQEATLMPAILGVQFSGRGYQFQRFVINARTHTGTWQDLKNSPLQQTVSLPHHVRLKLLKVNGAEFANPKKSKALRIVVLPTGDITPFKLMISEIGYNHKYELSVKRTGVVLLNEVGHHATHPKQ